MKAAGLVFGRAADDGVTWHTLRHSMATNARLAGVDKATIREMGNWKSDAMVEHYAKVPDALRHGGYAKVAGLLQRRSERHRSVTVDESAPPATPPVASPDPVTSSVH